MPNIDSFAKGKSDDFIPFKNFMNEFYAKDISNKVTATISIKGKRGERLTSNPVYGYKKDENSDWIVDEEAARTVKRIFDLYEQGNGVKMIAGMLSDENIPTPIKRTGRKSKYDNWGPQTVRRILECREYCGDTVNFKTRKLSFKSKKHIKIPKEDNMIFLDTQAAIISREQFNRVQELLLKKQRQPAKSRETSEPMLFNGIVKCKDCGAAMHGCRRTGTHPYTCSTYRKVYNRCTSHYIREDELITFVKEQLTELFEMFNENQLRAYLNKAVGQETQTELRNNQSELQTKRERVSEIDNVFKNLYEDKISGLITNEMFAKLYSKFEAEQNELKGQIYELSQSLATIKCDENKINTFVSVIKKNSDNFEVMNFSNEFLREIIDYIAVGEKVKEGTSDYTRELVIYYRLMGNINLLPKK